jgi:hypothetical protein
LGKKINKLHNDSKLKENKIEQMRSTLNTSLKNLSNSSWVSSKSKELNEQHNEKIFRKIFEVLTYRDESVEPKIDKFTDFSKLEEKVRNIVIPLFIELDEQNENLNLDEFVLACKQLYNLVSTEEKGVLLNWYNGLTKRRNENNEFTFKVILQ